MAHKINSYAEHLPRNNVLQDVRIKGYGTILDAFDLEVICTCDSEVAEISDIFWQTFVARDFHVTPKEGNARSHYLKLAERSANFFRSQPKFRSSLSHWIPKEEFKRIEPLILIEHNATFSKFLREVKETQAKFTDNNTLNTLSEYRPRFDLLLNLLHLSLHPNKEAIEKIKNLRDNFLNLKDHLDLLEPILKLIDLDSCRCLISAVEQEAPISVLELLIALGKEIDTDQFFNFAKAGVDREVLSFLICHLQLTPEDLKQAIYERLPLEAFQLMLDSKVELEANSLDVAISFYPSLPILQLLIQHGMSVNTEILQSAVYWESTIEVLELLIAHGAVPTQVMIDDTSDPEIIAFLKKSWKRPS